MTRPRLPLAALLLASPAWAAPQAIVPPVVGSAPSGATNTAGLVYASTTPVVVNSATPTSVFPAGSAAKRTLSAGALTPGRAFGLVGAGVYTAPVANTLSADITLKVGPYTIVAITTPAALVATNQGVDFKCECAVQAGGTTMICTGVFMFSVLGSNPVIVPFNSVTAKPFDPTAANLIDVQGDWNGATTTHATTVQTASLWLRN